MLKEKRAEKHVAHGITQFELSHWILNNLSQFNLKPTTKLVLMYLVGCYNPKHADVFPKQKTIADKIGISEASVIRAIQELHNEGLVISERKYTNRYKFTARILNLGAQDKDFLSIDKMQVETSQNAKSETSKLQAPYIEQEMEQEKEQTIKKEGGNVYSFQNAEDHILEEYAIKHGAKNVKAYVNTLKSSGSAAKIICEYKKQKKVTQRALCSIRETQDLIKQYDEDKNKACLPSEREAWREFGKNYGVRK